MASTDSEKLKNPDILVLDNPTKVYVDGGRVAISEHFIKEDRDITNRYYPNDISSLIFLTDRYSISGAAMKMLFNTEVLHMSNREPVCYLVPAINLPKRILFDKKIAMIPNSRRYDIAFKFCKGVCLGRIYEIRKIVSRNPDDFLSDRIKKMQTLERQLIHCKTASELKPIEGNIARHFFACIRHLIHDDVEFKSRDRFSGDLYNVLLNLSHGILRSQITRMLMYNGINTGWGFLHYQKDKNEHFLGWDFAEFWIPQVDKLCLYGINKGIFNEKSLKKSESGQNPYWVSKSGCKKMRSLMNRIKQEHIQQKIDEFRDSILNKKRFGWTICRGK